jgi:polyphosphate kinase
MHALINAAKNGKKVNCLVELRARFDEQNNITWSNRLRRRRRKRTYMGLMVIKYTQKYAWLAVVKRKKMLIMPAYQPVT